MITSDQTLGPPSFKHAIPRFTIGDHVNKQFDVRRNQAFLLAKMLYKPQTVVHGDISFYSSNYSC